VNASKASTTRREQAATETAAYLIAVAHRIAPLDLPLGLHALELTGTIPGLLAAWRQQQAQNERASRLQSDQQNEE
jgi:hypothetical protein